MTLQHDGVAEPRVSDDMLLEYLTSDDDRVADLAHDLTADRTQLAAERTRADEASYLLTEYLNTPVGQIIAGRTAAEAALAEAERTIAALREALEPFASAWHEAESLAIRKLAKHCMLAIPDDYKAFVATSIEGAEAGQSWPLFKFGDLRRAARLTAQAGETERGATDG